MIPFVPFDTDHFLANIPSVSELLDHYDEHRAALGEAIEQADTRPTGPQLTDIYGARPIHDPGDSAAFFACPSGIATVGSA